MFGDSYGTTSVNHSIWNNLFPVLEATLHLLTFVKDSSDNISRLPSFVSLYLETCAVLGCHTSLPMSFNFCCLFWYSFICVSLSSLFPFYPSFLDPNPSINIYFNSLFWRKSSVPTIPYSITTLNCSIHCSLINTDSNTNMQM